MSQTYPAQWSATHPAVKRPGFVLSWLFAWWLIYYNGEHWIFHRSFSTQSLCTTAAENLRNQGINARCAEIKGW